MLTTAPSATVSESPTAVGASFTLVNVIAAEAGPVVVVPSKTLTL